MNADQIKSQYSGYAGWNDPAAIIADFKATGGAGKGGPSSSSSGGGSGLSSTNPQDVINASIKAMQEANKPAVDSLTASIPEIQSKYAQTKTQLQGSQPSLEQRYQTLLDQIKGNQTQDVNAQTKATNATLAARGLSTQDAGAQQDMAGALSPINQNYSTLTQQTGLAREDAIKNLQDQIANLTPQETADTRAVQNAIAQLQSGAGSQGVSTGLNLYSTNLAAQTAAEKAKQDAEQQKIDNAIKQAQLANQTKQTNYDIGKPYSTADSSGIDLTGLMGLLGMGGSTASAGPTEAKPTTKMGAVSAKSPQGQWAWDYSTKDWYPVGK